MSQNADPFPTIKMTVPFLKELLARLRDDTLRHAITIVHAERSEEGEWILANTSARLNRSNIRVLGPEPIPPPALVEQALRMGAKVALVGEVRRAEDAQAMRAAAALGIRVAGVVTKTERREVEDLLRIVGPWGNYNVTLLSRQPPRR